MGPNSRCQISLNKGYEKTILTHTYNHRVDIVLPTDLYDVIGNDLAPTLSRPLRCWRFTAPLVTLLETGFWSKYIQSGNVVMLSKGRIDADNVYALMSGTLRLSLRHETYETAGLQGKPTRFGNTAGSKRPRRYLIEYNLIDPVMAPGKKSFERLQWSFTNVLTESVQWLFCDLNQGKLADGGVDCPVLNALKALPREMQAPDVVSAEVVVPSLRAPEGTRAVGGGAEAAAVFQREVWSEWALGVHEWLALLLLGTAAPADRIRIGDAVDPLLSTYKVDEGGPGSVTRLTWRGMVPAEWISRLWRTICKAMNGKEGGWAAITVHGFENSPVSWGSSEHGSMYGGENGYTVLRFPAEDYAGGRTGRYVVGEGGLWCSMKVGVI